MKNQQEQVIERIDSVYATSPENGVSKYYVFMSTEELIRMLNSLGWWVNRGWQTTARNSAQTNKAVHMLVFRNEIFSQKFPKEMVPEIILINSHNRLKKLHFEAGLYQFICGNGLIISDKTFESITIRHMGYDFNEVRDLIGVMTATLPNILNDVARFKSTILTVEEKREMAIEALSFRYPKYEDKDGLLDRQSISKHFDLGSLIQPLRDADKGDSVWNIFNILQEKMIKGGFEKYTMRGSRMQSKITNIPRNVDLNKALWRLAERYSD